MQRESQLPTFEADDELQTVVVRLFSDSFALTRDGSPTLSTVLGPLAADVGRCRLILDFSDVALLSAAGLGLLVRLHQAVRAAGGSLVLRNLDPAVYELFEVTRLTALLNVRRRASTADHPDRPRPLMAEDESKDQFPGE